MLWTIKDLSGFLQVKPSTLYAWVAQNKIPFHKVNGLIRFQPEVIIEWLQSCARGNVPPLALELGTANHPDLERLIARAKRDVYNPLYGETRPTSSPRRKEEYRGTL